MRRLFISTIGLLACALLCKADSISFPSNFIPFTSIYYVSGPDANGYSIVEGVLTTGSQNGALYEYLQSLPAVSGAELYSNEPIELAPGMYFANVLVPTNEEREGDFQDVGMPILDPQAGGRPFVGGIIPASRLFSPFAFRVDASLSAAPEPSGVLLVAFGLLLSLALCRRAKPTSASTR